jgi:outer membrane receptor for ferrienterochelin and colicins
MRYFSKGEKTMEKRVLLWVFILLIPIYILAEDSGRIQGRVRKAGNPVDGVDVILEEVSLSTITDKNGIYFFNRIPAGKYTLTFIRGENSLTKKGIEVTTNATTICDVDVEWEVLLSHAVTVYAASRRTERVVDAPAAVSVIEETEIERESAHGQLPKIFETTTGVDSTQSGLFDFNVNARGFNSTFNRRVLTLLDGAEWSGVAVDYPQWAGLSASINDLASIEMIRGPGAALYGANAYNGVINITTKDPRYSQGGMVRLSLGELSMGGLDLRYAGKLGKGWYFSVLGGYMESKDFSKSRNESVEYEGLPMEMVPLPLEKNKRLHAKIRLDKHFTSGSVLTFETWGLDSKGPTALSASGRLQDTRAVVPRARVNFRSSHWNIILYGYTADWEAISLGSGAPMFTYQYKLHGEVQGFTNFSGEKGRIVGGFSLRLQGNDTADKAGIQTFMSEAKDDHMEAVFGQLDYNLTEKLKVVLAGRLDFSTLHKAQISPKVSAVYTFNPGHSLLLSFNRAFQAPSYIQYFLNAPVGPPVDLSVIEDGLSKTFGMDLGLGFKSIPMLALGNENLNIEKITSYEIGYSNIFARKLIFNLNYYRCQLKNFVTNMLPLVNPDYGLYTPPSDLPLEIQNAVLTTLEQNLPPDLFALMSNSLEDSSALFAALSYTNAGRVNTQGIELSLKYFLNKHWKFDFNYTWFDFIVKEELMEDPILPNSPEHRVNLGAAYISDRLDVSMRYRWVDDFLWSSGIFVGRVKSYNLVDFTANYHFGNGFSLGFNISNLLNNKHYQLFGGDILRRNIVAALSYQW